MHFLWLPTLYVRNEDTIDALIPKETHPLLRIPQYFFKFPKHPIRLTPENPIIGFWTFACNRKPATKQSAGFSFLRG